MKVEDDKHMTAGKDCLNTQSTREMNGRLQEPMRANKQRRQLYENGPVHN